MFRSIVRAVRRAATPLAVAAVAAAAGLAGYVGTADKAEAHNYYSASLPHWEYLGGNPTFGRYLYMSYHGLTQNYWDGGAPLWPDGQFDFQGRWNQALSYPTAQGTRWNYLLINGNAPGSTAGNINISDLTRVPGQSFCGTVDPEAKTVAVGCMTPIGPYYSGSDPDAFHVHFGYNEVELNRYWGDTRLTNDQRKNALCHEVGHAIGLGHTGTVTQSPQPANPHAVIAGCMHWRIQAPGTAGMMYPSATHDNAVLNTIGRHTLHVGPTVAPIGLAPRRSPGNLKATPEAMRSHKARIMAKLPKDVRAKVVSGEWRIGEPEPLYPAA